MKHLLLAMLISLSFTGKTQTTLITPTTGASSQSIQAVQTNTLTRIWSSLDSSKKLITRTFTFTTSPNVATYTVANCINQYTATSLTCYSVNIGVKGCELVNFRGASSHSNMPLQYITLYSANVPMAADNATMTQTYSNLSNYFLGAISTSLAWLSPAPRGFVGSWSSVGNMQYTRGFFIEGSVLYFIPQISSGTVANPNANFSYTFVFMKP